MSGCEVLEFRVGHLLGAEFDDAVVVLLRIVLLHPSDDFLLPTPIVFLRRDVHLVLVSLEDVGGMIGKDLSGEHVASCGRRDGRMLLVLSGSCQSPWFSAPLLFVSRKSLVARSSRVKKQYRGGEIINRTGSKPVYDCSTTR